MANESGLSRSGKSFRQDREHNYHTDDRCRQETPLAYYKRQKVSGHGYVEGPTGYPYFPVELAPCRAPMPRAFPREGDMGGRTMSLEEYLQEKRVSYEEFLRARYAHEVPGIAGGLQYHPRRA